MKSVLFPQLLLAICFAAFGSQLAADPEANKPDDEDQKIEVDVKVAGLRVVEDGYGEGEGRITPLNWRRGTTIALMVSTEDGALLELNVQESELEVFSDDKGTDFLPDPGSARPAIGLYPQISGDRQAALVEILGDGLAAPDARELRIKGTLAMKIGGEGKSEQTEVIVPRAGAAAVLGDRAVAVLAGLGFPDDEEGAEEDEKEKGEEKGNEDNKDEDENSEENSPSEEEEEGVLSLRIDGEPAEVTDLRILDKKKEPLEVKVLGTRVIRRGDVRAIHRFQLPEGFDGEIVIEANVWDKPQTVRVPFEEKMSVGMGFGKKK